LATEQATKEKVDAEKTESILRGMFSAIQGAQLVAGNEVIAAMADVLFKSAGGKDYNSGTLFDNSGAMVNTPAMPLPANTSPGFPANPMQPEPEQSSPPQTTPALSPTLGANAGIETMQNETFQ